MSMARIYPRAGTYTRSGKKILHPESFFPRNGIVNSHSCIPLHLLSVLRGRSCHLLLPFTYKRSYQLHVPRNSWAYQTDLVLPPDWGRKCLKIPPGLGIPSQEYPGGYKVQNLKTVIHEKFQGRNLFPGLVFSFTDSVWGCCILTFLVI